MHVCAFVLQGNLVNFLRTRGRSVINSVQLLGFALWVQTSQTFFELFIHEICVCDQQFAAQHSNDKVCACVCVFTAMCVKGWSTWSPRSWCTEIWQLVMCWCLTTAWPRWATSAWPSWTRRCQITSSCRSNGQLLRLWRKRSVWSHRWSSFFLTWGLFFCFCFSVIPQCYLWMLLLWLPD